MGAKDSQPSLGLEKEKEMGIKDEVQENMSNPSSTDLGYAHVREESSPKKGDDDGSGKTQKDPTIDEIVDGMVDQCLSEPLAHDTRLESIIVRGKLRIS